MYTFQWTLLEEKVLYRTLKRFYQRYVFGTPKGSIQNPFYEFKGSIWNLLGSFVIICFCPFWIKYFILLKNIKTLRRIYACE